VLAIMQRNHSRTLFPLGHSKKNVLFLRTSHLLPRHTGTAHGMGRRKEGGEGAYPLPSESLTVVVLIPLTPLLVIFYPKPALSYTHPI
jgi:hypothetical protein